MLGCEMEAVYLRRLDTPSLEKPILLEGLPGFGNVGKIAANLLIEFLNAKPFAELYSPYLPDYILVNGEGICRLPWYRFYASSSQNKHFIIVTGDAQPSSEDVKAHYQLCSEILDVAMEFGCEMIITTGGIPSMQPTDDIYVAATSPKLAEEIMNRGAILYSKGRILGATGLLLGMAKQKRIPGICLLSLTTGLRADHKAALNLFHFLIKLLGVDIKEALG